MLTSPPNETRTWRSDLTQGELFSSSTIMCFFVLYGVKDSLFMKFGDLMLGTALESSSA